MRFNQPSLYFILFIASIHLWGCDEIEDPIIEVTTNYQDAVYGDAPEFDALLATDAVHRVLLEDFTAHQCGNCPAAGLIAAAIGESNGESVSVMAVHAGNLANTDDDHFDTDWTTLEGNAFWDQLDFQAYPVGRVNRSEVPGNFWAAAQWAEQTTAELDNNPVLGLQADHTWIPENNHLNIHVHGTFFGDVTGPVKVALLVLESHMIDYQLDYDSDPELVEDFEFNHVLRGSVHGAFGLEFGDAGAGAQAGDEAMHSVTYEWESDWVMENSTVLAVVTDGLGRVVNCLELHLPE